MNKVYVLLVLATFFSPGLSAQIWAPVGDVGAMVWDLDVYKNKLVIATYFVHEFDGTNCDSLGTYNNVLGSIQRSTECVRAINDTLYRGAHDFNGVTNSARNIHRLYAADWEEMEPQKFNYNGNSRIRDFESYNGSIYVSGQFSYTPNGIYSIARWSGSAWVRPDIGFIEVKKMLSAHNVLYAGGTDSSFMSKLFTYDGTNWQEKTPPANAYLLNIEDMAVFNNKLYISGSYSDMTGSYNIFTFDGSKYAGVSKYGDAYEFRKIYSDGAALYGIAKKTANGDIYLMQYNGTIWAEKTFLETAGTGVVPGYEIADFQVMQTYNGYLYLGGRFTQVGQKTNTTGLANIKALGRYPLSQSAIAEQKKTFERQLAYPNPCGNTLHLDFGAACSKARLEIYDFTGKQVKTCNVGNMEAIDMSALPAGMYFLQINGQDYLRTLKLVKE